MFTAGKTAQLGIGWLLEDQFCQGERKSAFSKAD